MRDGNPPISVKQQRDELARWIQRVREHADAERRSLGFLPEQVYEEAALQEKIFVAVARPQGEEKYAGHLLFGGSFPHLKVFQIYVAPDFRGRGVGTLLIDNLVRYGESLGYLSILARVAADLTAANQFWQRNGFVAARRVRGGTSTGRVIVVRVRELRTPTLFSVLENAESKDLRLEARLSQTHPTYALDLNVILDLTRQRANADSVHRIFNAALNRIFDLRVTEEFICELRRSSTRTPDPLLQLAVALPRFPRVPRDLLEPLIGELAVEIFPDRAAAGRLSAQDDSDLVHLCSAIHHKAAGFITSEKAILARRKRLQSKYALEVLGPAELAESTLSAQWSGEEGLRLAYQSEIAVSQLEESLRRQAEQFLESQSVSGGPLAAALSPGASGSLRRRLIVRASSKVIGLASWDPPNSLKDDGSLYLFVDEDHLGAEAILDYLLDRAVADASSARPVVLKIKLQAGQALARRAAVAHGFREAQSVESTSRLLTKICVGGFVTKDNWLRVRERVKKIASVVLPAMMPDYGGEGMSLDLRGPRGHLVSLSLPEIEILLGPSLFLFPGRKGVIVPIRRHFAEELFAVSAQKSLFPRQEAALFSERVYYSHPRTASVLKAGMPMFFYESKRGGGRGVVFACAKIHRVELRPCEGVTRDLERRGVLGKNILRAMSSANQIVVTYFQSVIILRRPVDYGVLRHLHCIDGANLVTARTLDTNQMCNLSAAGQTND